FDVAVDIRVESPTFGQWVGATLSEANKQMMLVPAGFAHGFAVLSDVADFQYKVTAYYSQAHDRGILWNDPALGIDWPLADPLLSAKDQAQPTLAEAQAQGELF
ncbi:dTDP-4-dehydrorhamnose 3,5-epimerase family protein, partial [Chloroflexota bacterium]